MVYCELKSKEDNILRYSVGSIISDVTGEIMINTQDMGFEITKQPDRSEIYPLYIGKLLRKYLPELEKGNAPKKMSYDN